MKENKLIAEFMGLCPLSRSGFISDKKQEYYGSLSDLQYHTSWDWLMPVVDKCYESGAEENEVGDITHALLDCDRKETHKAVVEFIKQLNKES